MIPSASICNLSIKRKTLKILEVATHMLQTVKFNKPPKVNVRTVCHAHNQPKARYQSGLQANLPKNHPNALSSLGPLGIQSYPLRFGTTGPSWHLHVSVSPSSPYLRFGTTGPLGPHRSHLHPITLDPAPRPGPRPRPGREAEASRFGSTRRPGRGLMGETGCLACLPCFL